jgi:hypothetical protein
MKRRALQNGGRLFCVHQPPSAAEEAQHGEAVDCKPHESIHMFAYHKVPSSMFATGCSGLVILSYCSLGDYQAHKRFSMGHLAVSVLIAMSDCITATKTLLRDMKLHANLDVQTAPSTAPEAVPECQCWAAYGVRLAMLLIASTCNPEEAQQGTLYLAWHTGFTSIVDVISPLSSHLSSLFPDFSCT